MLLNKSFYKTLNYVHTKTANIFKSQIMISTEQKVSWIDEVFEQNKTEKSLTTLKKEFDTIISKNSKSKVVILSLKFYYCIFSILQKQQRQFLYAEYFNFNESILLIKVKSH